MYHLFRLLWDVAVNVEISLGDIINNWRERTLCLESIPTMVATSMLEYLEVPFTYCWSPALVPKPTDWPSYIGEYTLLQAVLL